MSSILITTDNWHYRKALEVAKPRTEQASIFIVQKLIKGYSSDFNDYSAMNCAIKNHRSIGYLGGLLPSG